MGRLLSINGNVSRGRHDRATSTSQSTEFWANAGKILKLDVSKRNPKLLMFLVFFIMNQGSFTTICQSDSSRNHATYTASCSSIAASAATITPKSTAVRAVWAICSVHAAARLSVQLWRLSTASVKTTSWCNRHQQVLVLSLLI